MAERGVKKLDADEQESELQRARAERKCRGVEEKVAALRSSLLTTLPCVSHTGSFSG